MYKYAVVGKGMIGSAAARYLSKWSDGVVLIGPDEPTGEWSAHEGVFASHYDQGRITRRLDRSLTWALWGDRSIAAYAEIEAESGIRFHYPTGGITVGFRSDDPDSHLNHLARTALQLGTRYERLTTEAYAARMPALRFPDNLSLLYETDGAGYINPRSLVAAQVKLAERQGADIVRETVIDNQTESGGVTLTTDGDQTVRAEKVLVAAGGWTDYLTGAKLDLFSLRRTIVMARIDAAEEARLKGMPTIIWYEGCVHPDIEGVLRVAPDPIPGRPHLHQIGRSAAQ